MVYAAFSPPSMLTNVLCGYQSYGDRHEYEEKG